VNAHYANAPDKQKSVDLADMECYTCHKKGHYSNKCPQRQPRTALGTQQDGKPWCSHHQANTHSSEECWYLHPHLKDQAGGRQKNRKKQQSNARRAEAADGGGSGGPSGAQLQEMFVAFMLTQNPNTPGPRREDSYSGSVVELKVPVTPMSNTDQNRNRAGATLWNSKTLQARVAATTLTRKGPERQRLAGPQSNMPLGFLQQGSLTSRLSGGGEEDAGRSDEKTKAVLNCCDACSWKGHKAQNCPKRSGKQPAEEPEGDAEAVSKGPGEPEETTPGPEEPAGTKPRLQESSGTKSGSPGGRQTRSRIDALLQKEETSVGKPKTLKDMPKGFLELPRDDPQYQGIQGFRFGDFEEFPALGGCKNTTSGISKGPEEGLADDIEIVKEPVGGSQPGSSPAPSSTGKAPKDTAAVGSVAHPPAPIPFAEAPEACTRAATLPPCPPQQYPPFRRSRHVGGRTLYPADAYHQAAG
jgi:hypothetical protein